MLGGFCKLVGMWVSIKACNGLALEAEKRIWTERLEKEIGLVVEANVGGEGEQQRW